VRYFSFMKAAVKNDNSANFDEEFDRKYNATFTRGLRAYRKHLDKIASRLGPGAYEFFRFGFAETGLHDGFVLSLSMGDAVGFSEEQYKRLRFGKGKSIVELRILSYAKDFLHTFVYHRLRKVVVDIPSADPLFFEAGRTLGQVYSYEMLAVSEKYLKNEWLLDSGGTITIEFEKLIYKRKRLAVNQKKTTFRPKANRNQSNP
jgi:hypothetical protein